MSITTVVITGASTGIGAASARRFDREGYRLILLARRKDKLDDLSRELQQAEVAVFELDVTSRSLVEEVFHEIEQRFGGIDILINSAGGAYGLDRAYEADLDDWEKCIDVNIKGLVYCARQALTGMVKRNKGHIINLGSIAGHYPYPGGNVYCGVKAFVHQFSLNLRADLLGTAIRVSCIEPGLTAGTEFSLVRFHGDEKRAKSVYEKTEPLQAEDIAEVIFFTATLPSHININTIELMPVAQAFAPLPIHRNS